MSFSAVICCVNSQYIHSSLAPWYLYAGVKSFCSRDISAEVVEGTVNEKLSDVCERIISRSPDAVGFCCYIWNISFVLKAAEAVKKALPDIKIILGGPEVSFNAERVMEKNSFVDFIISGEGEKVFAEVLTSLSKGEKPQKGLACMRDGDGISGGVYQICEEEISPYCEEYYNSLATRIAYIESSRGCPYHCAFCLSGADKSVRFFDLVRVKSEMLALCAAGAKTIKFVDRTFNCNRKRAEEILRFIKDNYGQAIPEGVCFHFEIAADILTDETIGLIGSMPSGSVQFEAGIQSFNADVLERCRRKTDMPRLCENIKKLASLGNCHIHIDLIAGLAGEDMNSFRDSFNKAYALGANMLQLGFLKILHGSHMEDDREKYPCKYGEEPPYEVISTPWISEAELKRLHFAEDALERLHNSGRFKRTLEYIMSHGGKSPFDVFDGFGEFAAEKGVKQPPLDLYTLWVYEYFGNFDGLNPETLRDKMITDRIATNSSGIIPEVLKIRDDRLRAAKRYLAREFPITAGVKRTAAILYSEGKLVWCDYTERDSVSGEYKLNFADFVV